jgi:hypothetical protein
MWLCSYVARAAAAVAEVTVEVHLLPPPPAVPAPQPAMVAAPPLRPRRRPPRPPARGPPWPCRREEQPHRHRQGGRHPLPQPGPTPAPLPLVRRLLASLRPGAPTRLLRPDTPLAGLLALDSLLAHGTAGPGDARQAAATASLLGVTMRGLETLSPDEPRHEGISVKENTVSSEEDSNQKEISTAAESKEMRRRMRKIKTLLPM